MSYEPSAFGTVTSYPCAFCGGTAFALSPVPSCIACDRVTESVTIAAESIRGHLALLLDLAERIPPATRAVLLNDMKEAGESLDWLVLALELAQ